MLLAIGYSNKVFLNPFKHSITFFKHQKIAVKPKLLQAKLLSFELKKIIQNAFPLLVANFA